MPLPLLRTRIDCGSTERYGGINGIYDGYALLVWKNTREMEFSLQTSFRFNNGIPRSLMAKYSWTRLDRLRHGSRVSKDLFPSTELCFRLFLHDGMGLCFLFFLSHYLARLFRQRADWVAGLPFSLHPKDPGVLYI